MMKKVFFCVFALLLFLSFTYAGSFLTSVQPVDIKSVDSAKFDFDFTSVKDSAKTNTLVLNYYFKNMLFVGKKYFLVEQVREITYPEIIFSECLKKRSKSFCLSLAGMRMKRYEENLKKYYSEKLINLSKSVEK